MWQCAKVLIGCPGRRHGCASRNCAGLDDLHIHDLRGRAGMDKRDADGLEAAKELLGHKTMRQTSDYVDGKAPRKVKPSK